MNTTRASLLVRIKDLNDSHAWGEFDAIYRPLLRRFAQARKLAAADVEEIVQETMLTVTEHIGEFAYEPGKGSFRGWLLTIVNNKISSRFRRQEPMPADTEQLAALASSEKGPAELFDLMWMEEHLRACLGAVRGEVPAATFDAYEMYVIKQKEVNEVCAAVGINANLLYQIKYRLNRRVLEKFRELVGSEEADAWLSQH